MLNRLTQTTLMVLLATGASPERATQYSRAYRSDANVIGAAIEPMEVTPVSSPRSIGVLPLEPRMAGVTNVLDFGAKADGIADDTAAIQAAIRAAGTGTVFLPQGTYMHTGLSISGSVQLIGAGWEATVLKNTHASRAGISIIAPTPSGIVGARIFNLNLVGAGRKATGPGIYVRSEGNTILDRVFITYSGGAGLFLDGHTSVLTVKDCRFQDNVGDGVYGRFEKAKQLNAINIIGSHFIHNAGHGINLWAQNVNIRDGVIQGNRKAGIYFNADDMATPNSSATNINVVGNWFEANSDGAIVGLTRYKPPVIHFVTRLHIYDNMLSLYAAQASPGVAAVVRLLGASASYRGLYLGRNSFSSDSLADVDFGNIHDYGTVLEAELLNSPDFSTHYVNSNGVTVRGWATWSRVSPDRGDVSVTLQSRVDDAIQRFATALTTNRVVSLTRTNAQNGDSFRIVRTGLGPFALDIGPGLKVIPANTAAFVEVVYDGSAWRLTGYGTL